jgi:FkbM family methyltransferase
MSAIRQRCFAATKMPTLCIEGVPAFVRYLRHNLGRLPSCIAVEECFVGAQDGYADVSGLNIAGGTASLAHAQNVSGAAPQTHVPILSLDSIFKRHPAFATPKLIKLDTDGDDFGIITASRRLFASASAVLYFEYHPSLRQDGPRASLEAISALVDGGYRNFLIYDNFGNLMTRVRRDVVQHFEDLNCYLLSHRLFGPQIYYLDVCAFMAKDEDLCEALYSRQREVVNASARKAGWLVPDSRR